ncbi:MAG: S8 family peptidase [Fimbriimonadaceae bacterium]|nr:S8 family peptidase [Fimbriimonadaceae bacterium]
MLKKLETARTEGDNRSAIAVAARDGIYLEFESFDDGFPIGSLENRKKGIQLLNVRKVEASPTAFRALATVYVPAKSAGYFQKKLEEYRNEDTRFDKPKNQALVSRIDDIRCALTAGFWTDDPSSMPGLQPKWVEVWLSTDKPEDVERFRELLQEFSVEEHPARRPLYFPERCVILVRANQDDLSRLIDHSDLLAEFRRAQEPATFFRELDNAGQAQWVDELMSRTDFEDPGKVSVCILDTGVTAGHPLLQPVMGADDALTVDSAWGVDDRHRHGTLMSGLAAYGNLQDVLASSGGLIVSHRLQSVKILPMLPDVNPEQLWGEVTARGIALAEIAAPNRRRVFCLAVTAETTRREGRPTSWSGEIDQLAAGVADDGALRRLIIVSAGNVSDAAEWSTYPGSNKTNSINDPAQAWNALTVGACTWKTRIFSESLDGYSPVAEAGGLSPFSKTSGTWPDGDWPIKPEVVLEGGNVARKPVGGATVVDDLLLLSTGRDPNVSLFGLFAETSAATALAGNLAASIWSAYPDLWPETVRGLIIHSAEWTDAMRRQFGGNKGNKGSIAHLLRSCGYGVPDLGRATQCLSNRVTLVAEREIQPFDETKSREMHLYELPWPQDVLEQLGGTQVTMRVTLSYFIEPGPGEIGWKDRYRYASAGLRFEINSPGETQEEFLKRINKQEREKGEKARTSGPSDKWMIGQKQRTKGSVHSDIWQGTAADLAASSKLAVFPAIGWWRQRSHLGRSDRKLRYTLIVSIATPENLLDVDIYTPVLNSIALPIENLIEIKNE